MRGSKLQVLLALVLIALAGACQEGSTSPAPTATQAPTQFPIAATPEATSTSAPQVIPGGVQTASLAADGQVLVSGEVDSATGKALFLDSAGWLHVFDGASLVVTGQKQALPPLEEGYLYDLAIDSEARRIYVADGARDEILILDAEILSPMGRVDGSGRIAVDPVTGLLYVAQVGVYVADGETGEIVDYLEDTVPEEGMELFSGVPRGVDVFINPDSRHLYVMMDNNTPGSNSRHWLDLYDADDYALLAEYVPSFNWFSDAPGFDLARGLDYVSGGHPIAGHRKLIALNAEGGEVAHLWGVRGDVFFSSGHNLIYLAGWDELDIVDAETMNYLDVYPFRVSLHDPRNGRFYDVDWGSDASVTVFDEPAVALGPRRAVSEWVGRLPTDEWTRISSLVLSPSFSNDRTLLVVVGTSVYSSADGGDNWMETILPFEIRGITLEVGLSPTYSSDGTLLVGVDCAPAGGGILRSADGGRQFARANSGLTDLGIADLIFSPGYDHDGTVFVRGCFDGVFKSTDGGTIWRASSPYLVGEGEQETVSQLVVSPSFTRDETLWALSSSHVYRSRDAGDSWRRADRGLEGLELDKLVVSPEHEADKTAFVTAGRGVYVTLNAGEAWEKMELPSEELWVTDLLLSPGFATDGVLFVLGFDGEYRDRLFRSSDGGETWLGVGEQFPNEYFTAFSLSPRYSEDGLVLLVTETGVHRSTDGGEMWQALSLPGSSTASIAFAPDDADAGTIYASLGGGLYRSRDLGDNWSALHDYPASLPTAVASPIPSPNGPPSASPVASPFVKDCPGLDPFFEDIAEWLTVLQLAGDDVPAVGCPTGPAYHIGGAWQRFLLAATANESPWHMIWRSDESTVYVVRSRNRSPRVSEAWVYQDTWSEGMPEIPSACAGLTPPDQLEIPVRGFGKIWCDNSLHQNIGFGYGSEQGGNLLIQETRGGLYLGLPDGPQFAIDVANGLALSW